MKIGILGGTFNPIHNAHLTLAEFARAEFLLDRVLLMPANIPALKDTSNLVDKDHRANMVKLAISSNSKFELSRIDIDRPGKSYSVDSFEDLNRRYPSDELYLIIGADSFLQIEKWDRFEKLIKLTNIIVASRADCNIFELEAKKEQYIQQYGAKVLILDLPNIEISSTMIRDRIIKDKSVQYLLPDAVYSYMKDNKLYMNKE